MLTQGNIPAHPDQKYVDALVNNDSVILNLVYKKFLPPIQRMVLQNNGSDDDAYDLFQNALLSIYNKAKTEGFILTCPLEAFLFTICKNRWITELQKRKSQQVTNIDSDRYINIQDDSSQSVEGITQARNDLIKEKLSQIGEGCKQLLELNWSGNPLEKVADMLGLTYGSVRKKKSQCMQKLVSLVRNSPMFESLTMMIYE